MKKEIYVGIVMINGRDLLVTPYKDTAFMERASLDDVEQINAAPTADWPGRFRIRLSENRETIRPWSDWFAITARKQAEAEKVHAEATRRTMNQPKQPGQVIPIDDLNKLHQRARPSMAEILAGINVDGINKMEYESMKSQLDHDLASGDITADEYNRSLTGLNNALAL